MKCTHCDRQINNKGSLASHEQVCKLNPNKTIRTRSENAGAQKGQVPWNKGLKTGTNPCWKERFPDESIFIENSKMNRKSIKTRIINEGMIDYICDCCGIGPIWQNKPMPLILDHINGINNDHRLENLRFVCSNCDTQLPTYKSKNRKK